MSDVVGRLRALQVCLRPPDFLLTLADRCFGRLDLVLKFGNFEDGYQLSHLDVIANIDINPLHVTGNLRMDFDFLIGPEFRSHCEGPREVGTVNFGCCNGRRSSGIWLGLGGVRRARYQQHGARKERYENERRSYAPQYFVIRSKHKIVPPYSLLRPTFSCFGSR